MRNSIQSFLTMVLVTASASAQVRLPSLPVPALPLQTLPQTVAQVQTQSLDRLSEVRHLEIERLIRRNSKVVDADPNDEPVVRNEILGMDLSDTALNGARSLGFIVDREQSIEAMNIRVTVSTVKAAECPQPHRRTA